jgi:hypothetical protein
MKGLGEWGVEAEKGRTKFKVDRVWGLPGGGGPPCGLRVGCVCGPHNSVNEGARESAAILGRHPPPRRLPLLATSTPCVTSAPFLRLRVRAYPRHRPPGVLRVCDRGEDVPLVCLKSVQKLCSSVGTAPEASKMVVSHKRPFRLPCVLCFSLL